MEPTYMIMVRGYVESMRFFENLEDAYDFLVEVIRKTKFIHHKQGVDWMQIYVSSNKFSIYKIYYNSNANPEKIKKLQTKKEFLKRGLVCNKRGWWE